MENDFMDDIVTFIDGIAYSAVTGSQLVCTICGKTFDEVDFHLSCKLIDGNEIIEIYHDLCIPNNIVLTVCEELDKE